jgi:hypothetical protein
MEFYLNQILFVNGRFFSFVAGILCCKRPLDEDITKKRN